MYQNKQTTKQQQQPEKLSLLCFLLSMESFGKLMNFIQVVCFLKDPGFYQVSVIGSFIRSYIVTALIIDIFRIVFCIYLHKSNIFTHLC